jgi:hypothetical protein
MISISGSVVHLPVFGKMFRGFGGNLGSTLLCFKGSLHDLYAQKIISSFSLILRGFAKKCLGVLPYIPYDVASILLRWVLPGFVKNVSWFWGKSGKFFALHE